MGQEAGLAGVAAVGLESRGDSWARQRWAQQEELGICGSHSPLPALNLGHSFEGRLLSLLNPSAHRCSVPIHPEAREILLKSLCVNATSCLAAHHASILHRSLSYLLCVSEERMSFTQKLCKYHFLCWKYLLLSPNSLIISLEISYFPSPKTQSSLLQDPSPHSQLYSGSYCTFVPGAGFHYSTYTPWQFIGDLSAPHYWTVNYSSLPGNMVLLNKCMWDEYRNYSLLLFVLLPILQGPAQMSPPLFWIPYPGRINHTFCVPVALYTHFYYSTYQIASYFIIGLPRATTTPESTIHTEPGNTEILAY